MGVGAALLAFFAVPVTTISDPEINVTGFIVESIDFAVPVEAFGSRSYVSAGISVLVTTCCKAADFVETLIETLVGVFLDDSTAERAFALGVNFQVSAGVNESSELTAVTSLFASVSPAVFKVSTSPDAFELTIPGIPSSDCRTMDVDSSFVVLEVDTG